MRGTGVGYTCRCVDSGSGRVQHLGLGAQERIAVVLVQALAAMEPDCSLGRRLGVGDMGEQTGTAMATPTTSSRGLPTSRRAAVRFAAFSVALCLACCSSSDDQTTETVMATSPVWSEDGSQIAYALRRITHHPSSSSCWTHCFGTDTNRWTLRTRNPDGTSDVAGLPERAGWISELYDQKQAGYLVAREVADDNQTAKLLVIRQGKVQEMPGSPACLVHDGSETQNLYVGLIPSPDGKVLARLTDPADCAALKAGTPAILLELLDSTSLAVLQKFTVTYTQTTDANSVVHGYDATWLPNNTFVVADAQKAQALDPASPTPQAVAKPKCFAPQTASSATNKDGTKLSGDGAKLVTAAGGVGFGCQ